MMKVIADKIRPKICLTEQSLDYELIDDNQGLIIASSSFISPVILVSSIPCVKDKKKLNTLGLLATLYNIIPKLV